MMTNWASVIHSPIAQYLPLMSPKNATLNEDKLFMFLTQRRNIYGNARNKHIHENHALSNTCIYDQNADLIFRYRPLETHRAHSAGKKSVVQVSIPVRLVDVS